MQRCIYLSVAFLSPLTPGLIAASAEDGAILEWQRIVATTPLPALPARIAEQNPPWPKLAYSPEHPESQTLAIELSNKITAYEAEQKGKGNLPPGLLETYAALANELQRRGGYYNLLLADTLLRLSYCRVAHELIANPDKHAEISQRLARASLPSFQAETFAQMLREEFAASADLGALKELGKDQTEKVLKKAVKWDGIAPRSIEAPDRLSTSYLLKQALPDAMLARMMYIDWRLNQLTPALVSYLKGSGKLDDIATLSDEALVARMDDKLLFEQLGTLRGMPISPRQLKDFVRDFSKDLDTIEEYQWAVK